MVKGTLDSFTADNPATEANEESVTLPVTKAEAASAKRSGEHADQGRHQAERAGQGRDVLREDGANKKPERYGKAWSSSGYGTE